LLADFLADSSVPWPDQLTLAACADAERDGLLTELERNNLNERFEKAKSRLDEFRAKIHSDELVSGIPAKVIRDALLQETARLVIALVVTAARQCSGNQ
jgi:hypothetical protein